MMGQLKQHKTEKTGTLFQRTSDFRIVTLREADAKKISDNLKTLQNLIVSNEQMYPNIERWFANKVIPGLRTKERIGYVAYENEFPIASAILKRGEKAKFCHLRIHRDFQDLDLGQMFFTQMTFEARHDATEIHFTLPESLWFGKMDFFQSFGFTSAIKARRQYRNGEDELSCSAPLSTVKKIALERLPYLMARFSLGGFSSEGKILISLKPDYARQICAGIKLIEIRRKFSPKWAGCKAVLYASSPVSSLVGEATVSSVTCGSPDAIWAEFGPRVGSCREEFYKYVAGAENISAIEVTDVIPYISPVGLAQISHLMNHDLRPPQSFCDIKIDSGSIWAKAVSVANLLHGNFALVK